MNKKFFSFFIGMAMVVAGLTLASCSNNDDEKEQSTNTATSTPLVYCSEAMMAYFDVTCTIDGKAVTLTKDNTEAVEQTLYDSNDDPMYFKMRCYKGETKKHTSFPSTSTIVENVKVKSGVDLKTIERLDQFVMYIRIDTDNTNNNTWDTNYGVLKNKFQEGVHFNEMDADYLEKYKDVSLTSSVNMTDYKNATYTSSFSVVW